MRIVFMGSPDFAIPSLEKLHDSSHEIAAVVSNVDKRRGRRSQPPPTPVKARALELGLPAIAAEALDDPAFHQQLKDLEADLCVVVALRILPEALLALPRKASISRQASVLPKQRGAAPIHWAVMQGEQVTGCTIFFLDDQVDTGKIIKQQQTKIGLNETTGDVYDRLKEMGSSLLVDAVVEIAEDSYQLTKQN